MRTLHLVCISILYYYQNKNSIIDLKTEVIEMKIAVIGANGKAGSLIVKEAVERNHDVTAIVRSTNKTVTNEVIEKDLFDLTKNDLKKFDVVISAIGAFTPETFPIHSKSIEYLTTLLADSDIRFLVVGGAGSLYIDNTHTTRLLDTSTFPEEFKPLATAQADELDLLRTKNNVKWTFISPAANFIENGEKTNKYATAGEVFTVNQKGESSISYADYASAMLDEVENGNHIQQRISVYRL